MFGSLLPLGQIPLLRPLATWGLMQLTEKVKSFVQDPSGAVGRIGDVLVWRGESGQKVIGTLEALSESNERIEQVVGKIESAQIGMASTLGTLTSLSMATLGVTSLAAGFMIYRMNILHNRANGLNMEILRTVQARDRGDLQTSLKFLGWFEETPRPEYLNKALENAAEATERYRISVNTEIGGEKRLRYLNTLGRSYLLSLTAQTQCQILENRLPQAANELTKEKGTLEDLAKATFDVVMNKSPEAYLDPNLKADHVTLDLVTEVYQAAHRLGALSGEDFKDASQMFEHFRPKIYAASRWFRPSGRAKEKLLTNLRYLMACLEEVSRIESLRLRIEAAIDGKLSFEDLNRAVATAKDQEARPPENKAESAPVVAFAFA